MKESIDSLLLRVPLELRIERFVTPQTITLLYRASKETRTWVTDPASSAVWRSLANDRWHVMPSQAHLAAEWYKQRTLRELKRPIILFVAVYTFKSASSELALRQIHNYVKGDYPALVQSHVHPNVESMMSIPVAEGNLLAFRWSLNWSTEHDDDLEALRLSVWPVECFVQQGRDTRDAFVCLVPLADASDKVYLCIQDMAKAYYTHQTDSSDGDAKESDSGFDLERVIDEHDGRLRKRKQ